ncbi:trigger factor [Paracoccaceae bacterium GXU_MW_L88]
MQVKEIENSGLTRKYELTLPASDLDAKVNEKLETARKDFQMKGFRKGKAPLSLMKQMFGKSVLGESLQEAIDAAMGKHFEETGDRPAQQPDVKMTNEEWKEGDDVVVSLEYETLPEVPDVDVSDITIEKPVVEIEDEAVDEALQNLAGSAKNYKPRAKTHKAKDGDQVVIDFVGKLDGEAFEGGTAEDYPLVLGSGSFIPGFEEQVVGMKTGDEKDINVTFPENYGAENLAGKEVVFSVTAKEVKAPEDAEIDDELAKQFGMDDLDALKAQVKERLGAEYENAARQVVKRRLMDALDGKVDFELPPALLTAEANQIAHQLWHEENPDHQGHDHGEIEPTDEHKKIAERRVRLGLLLADIGNKKEIGVSDAELQQAVMNQARQYPGQERQFFEFVQKNPQALDQIRAPLFEDKVVDHILEQAKVDEKAISKDDLQKLIEEMDEA